MRTIGRRPSPGEVAAAPASRRRRIGRGGLACGRAPSKDEAAPARPPPRATAGPAITIALLPERNVFEQKKRYQPLQDYLSARDRAAGRPSSSSTTTR